MAAGGTDEEFSIYRETSVQPGTAVNIWLEVPVPVEWSFQQFKALVADTYPGQEFKVKRPKEVQIEGKDFVTYGVYLKQDITREIKRVLGNLVQQEVTRTKAAGVDYPTERIMSIYGLAGPKDEDVDMGDGGTKRPQAVMQPSGGSSSGAQQGGGSSSGAQAAPRGPSGSGGPVPAVQQPPGRPRGPGGT